jgi:predicted TIM-barrel fold metal-dependent hydrolase
MDTDVKDGAPLIDTHVHIMTEWRIRGLARWMKKAFPQHPVSETVTPMDLVNDLKEGGITHFFNLVYPLSADETESLNEFNTAFCRDIPGAIPFAGIHLGTPDKAAYAEKCLFRDGAAGFKLHPFIQKFDPWDRQMDPFYGFLQEAGKPVLFHTGFEMFYGKDMAVAELRKFLKRFPRLPAVFVHMAFPHLGEVFDMMDEFPELYLDATGVFVFFRRSFRPYLSKVDPEGRFDEILEKNLEKYRHRIFFGSDHPVGWGDISKVFKDLQFIPATEETKTYLKYQSAMDFIDRFHPGFDWSRRLS